MGPTAILQGKRFEEAETLKQIVMAIIAIYAEAAVIAFVHFVHTLRFWYLWRGRSDSRSYSRRLRGISLPNCIVPLRHDESTNTQIIRGWNYVGMAVIATIIACLVGLPSILYGSGDDVDGVLVAVSLFILITIGTRGNVLAGVIFTLERLDNDGIIEIRTAHVEVALPVFYSCWLLFQSVVVMSRIRVYSSPDASLRALAKTYLLPVTVDVAVSTKARGAGRIDEGKMHINLRQDEQGAAVIDIAKERETQKVTLDHISRIY